MSRSLYPYQKEAVEFHLAHHYSLNCSEMGTGKSLMALETARRTGHKVAVIGPPFLRGTWDMESRAAGVEIMYFPYTMLDRETSKRIRECKFWIGDEFHYLKSPTANRTAAFYKLLLEYPPEYLVGLTGTPVKNRAPDFWTLLGFCAQNPKKTSGLTLEGPLRKYHGFCRHFCEIEKAFIGRGRVVDKYGALRDDRTEEFRRLLKDKFIRYRVADVLKDLPEITRKEIYLDLEEVPGLEEEFSAYLRGHKTNSTGKCTNALVKAPLTAQYCRDIFDETGEKLLIFTDHVESAKLLAGKLLGSDLRAKVITGSVSAEDRARAVENFQAGELDAIVATIGSLSTGVTLTAANHVVFNDLSWVPSDNLQAEKRIHRIGQKKACFSHYVISSPTDSHIQKTLASKLETINKIMGA